MSGVKGKSGRKSKYQELADVEALRSMFFDEFDPEELIDQSGTRKKFSVKQRLLLTALEGDTTVLTTIFKKVFPDKMDIMSDGKAIEGNTITFKGFNGTRSK